MKREHRFFSMVRSTVKDTVQNIQRNNLMSFASVVSIVAALIILGAFIIITINVDNIATAMVESLELKVFLTSDFNTSYAPSIEETLDNTDYVTGYVFEPKDEALAEYSERLEEYSGLLEGFNSSNNPVSDSYTVTVDSPEHLQDVKEDLEGLGDPLIKYVKYGEEYLEAITLFDRLSKYVCLGVLFILSIISLVIIYNTIKLTCYSNRKEIEIMQFIGAENWYIKLPFFIEGLVLGILGSACATLILATVYTYLIGMTNVLVTLPLQTELVAPTYVVLPILFFSLIYGTVIGAFGSLFSIRKFFNA